MSKDIDILPPIRPGDEKEDKTEEKKQGFFSKLFSKKKKEEPIKNNSDIEEIYNQEVDNESDHKSIADKNISDDIANIRSKLGLDNSKSTTQYFDQLEQNKNADLENESNLYDESHDDQDTEYDVDVDNVIFSQKEIQDHLDAKRRNYGEQAEYTFPEHEIKAHLKAKANNYAMDDKPELFSDEEIKAHIEAKNRNAVISNLTDEHEPIHKGKDNSEFTSHEDDLLFKPEKIDQPIFAEELATKTRYSQVTPTDSNFDLPKMALPKDIEEDPRVYLDATREAKKDLTGIQKETENLMDDIRDIVLEKKRKLFDNLYVMPNKTKLASILTLKKFTKNKSTYEPFKSSIIDDRKSFTKWVNDVLKIQKETEKALEKELYSKVNALFEIYLHKMEGIVSNFLPITTEELNEFKVKEKNLDNKLKYLKDFELELKLNKSKVTKLERKYNKDFADLKKSKIDFKTEKENKLNELKQHKLDQEEFYKDKFDEFDKWSKEQKDMLETKKQQFKEESETLKHELLEEKHKYVDLKHKTEKEYSRIHPEFAHMTHEKEQFQNRKEIIENKLKEREDAVIQKIMYNESLLGSIAKQKEELLSLKEEVDKGGFKNYLDKSLTNLPDDDVINTKEDTNLSHTKVMSPAMAEVDKLADLINICRTNLDNEEYSEAKKTYNQVRTQFMYINLDESQKQDFYNQIRELYDDINIKLLEEQAKYHL